MRYGYTAYYETDEERIKAISEDILSEYPKLGYLAEVAAKMEKPFGRVHEDYSQFSDDENYINRLIDIVIVTEGNPDLQSEYEKACEDLESSFRSWQYNFTYANPEEQAVYIVMQRYFEHLKDKSKPLMTVKEADEIVYARVEEQRRQEKWIRDHTMQYNYTAYYEDNEERVKAIVEDMLREYPNLGPLAEEAARMEKPFGRVHEDYDQFSNQENYINRLIDIVIVTEGKTEFQAEYEKACNDLERSYESWKERFSYANPEDQAVYIVMQSYYEHQKDKSKPLMTVKEADKVLRFKRDAEARREKWIMDHTMQYNYTAYYETDEERIQAIVADIQREYPNLGPLAEEAAKMETPFGQRHEDYDQFSSQENHINRLIDIVIVTEGKPEFQAEYEKACRDLEGYYESWQDGFTYANPEDQAAYIVMQRYFEHMEDKSKPLITFKQGEEESRKIYHKREIQDKADFLRYQYPNLGPLAEEVIELEEQSGVWMRFQENDLIRLVYIIKLAEDKPEYREVYEDAIEDITDKYAEWLEYEARNMSPEQQMVAAMVERLKEHLQNRSVPLATFPEIKKEFESQDKQTL